MPRVKSKVPFEPVSEGPTTLPRETTTRDMVEDSHFGCCGGKKRGGCCSSQNSGCLNLCGLFCVFRYNVIKNIDGRNT